jgi:hypothetical protein
MPDREDLPPEVGAITRSNALELSDQRWRSDVGRLMTRLDELIDEPMSRPGAAAERGIRSGRETAPPSRDEATTSVEAKPAPGRAGRRLRWALLAAVAIGVIAVAVVVALGGGDSAPPAHFNAPDLKNLVLPSTEPPDEGTPGGGALTFKRSLEGEKARDALMDLPNVDRLPAGLQAAYVNHWGTFNPADEPDHADAAAAVFADETAARDAIAALSARWYGDAPLSTEGLGENGKAIVGSGKGFTDVVYAWQTGNLLQLVSVYSTFPRGVCGEERPCDPYDVLAKFARESADKMAALASNQNGG